MATRRQLTAFLGSTLLLSGSSRVFAETKPIVGGELIFGLDGAAVVKFLLDPHNSGFAPHNRVFRSIFDSLVVLKPDQSVGPWLAMSWNVSPDQKTYTFKLRTDVIFHDGTPFNAQAVKINLDRISKPENGLVVRPDIGPYAGAEVIDDATIRVVLSQPFSPFLHNLSMTTLGIISPVALLKYGDTIGQNPVGTGPFKFISLTQGTEIRLTRNDAYQWAPATAVHAGPAYLDRLTFKNVPEELTRVAALQSRQLHAVDSLPPQNIVALRGDKRFNIIEKELLNNNYTLYLNAARPPWNDEDIRTAVQLSLDVDAIVRVIYLGTLPRAWAPLSPSMFASADKVLSKSWKPDPKRAADTLDAKGWKAGRNGVREKDGIRLSISFIDTQGNREKRLDVIQFARRQLAKNGIELTIDSQPAGSYLEKLTNGEFDLSGGSQFAADPDVLRRLHLPKGRAVSSISKVNDPDISRWLEQATAESDAEKRVQLYESVQRRLVSKAYAIPVYVLLYNIASTSEVTGLTIDTHGFPTFHDTRLSA